MKTKVCVTCGREKLLTTDFFYYHKKLDKMIWVSSCIVCERKRSKDKQQRMRELHPGKSTLWYHSMTDERRELHRYTQYIAKLKRRYKVNEQFIRDIMDQQKGCCAICGQSLPLSDGTKTGVKHFAVDHCHNTLKVRGLLCQGCNLGIGCLQDSVSTLKKAIQYLEEINE